MTPSPWGPRAFATAAVAAVQLFNALLWTAYVVHLPAMIRHTGLGAEILPYLLVADQLVFAVMDPLCGAGAQQIGRLWRFAGPILVGVVLIATGSLLALPVVAKVGPELFVALLLLWAVTASVLRAPVMALLHQHVPPGAFPGAAGVSLVGLGVAGALSPYLTVVLRAFDPLVPFVAASAALIVAALALAVAERRRGPPTPAPPTEGAWLRLAVLAAGVASLTLAFQLHSAVRAAALWSAQIGSDNLPFAIPTFWVAFSLGIAPLGLASRRWPLVVTCAGGLLFTVGAGLSAVPHVAALALGQLVAGLGWSGVFGGGLSAVIALTSSRWTGLGIGAFFCIGSFGTAIRMSLNALGLFTWLGAATDLLVVVLACIGAVIAGLAGLGRRG